MSYWKFGGGYSYRTPRSKKTGWSKTLAGVPASAKGGTTATKKKPKKSSPKRKTGGRKTVPRKKKSKRRGGFRLPGGVGPKGILTGVLGLAIVPQFLPVQSPGAVKLGTGLALRALNLGGGGALSTVGIMELAAELIGPAIGGFVGGGGNASGPGRYMY